MKAKDSYFGRYNVQMPNVISFDGVEHPWQVPELLSSVESFRKLNPELGTSEAQEYYENSALGSALLKLGKRQPFYESYVGDNLLYDDEADQQMNFKDALMTDYKDLGLKSVDDYDAIPEQYKSYLIAQRMRNLNSRSFGSLRDYATSLYNEKGREEAKKWEYKPEVLKDLPSPVSREFSNPNASKQKIDTSVSLEKQTPTSDVPWGTKHPLRLMWINENITKLSKEDFNTGLDKLDSMYGTKDNE
jgi:hypothetical protein